jgi:phosphate starvation-inducible protein PhoH and related proteins
MSDETSLTLTLTLADRDEAVHLFGHHDHNLRLIKDAFPDVKIIARGDTIQINGPTPAVERAERAFAQLRQTLQQQGNLTAENVRTAVAVAGRDGETGTAAAPSGPLPAIAGSRHVRPRTAGQAKYVTAMRENDVIFAIGPAGTGKTYLSVAVAVTMLRQGTIKKIVLVRPAVEAGEKLGFLPGDIAAKINPYLRPLLDALNDMMEPEQVKRYMDNDIIEIAPLAFMRGRTLNAAVIILDEGQNTTVPQMQMFLTRMGHGSKIIATGDITQVDLPKHTRSGLIDAVRRLENLERIAIIHLGEQDIVRHPLVQAIVKAYEDDKPRKRRSEA